MPQKFKVKLILKNARQIRTVWQANPDVKMGEVNLHDFLSICNEAEELAEEYSRKRNELTGIRNKRDNKVWEVNKLITRFRSAMRAFYGPDSSQYAQSGATRTSERKRPIRRSKA